MKLRSILGAVLAALVLASSLAVAACVQDAGDPFDPAATMPRGRYRGRCLDGRELRTLKVLTAVAAAQQGVRVPPGSWAVANVRHADRFWIAVVDPAAVTDVILQIENFPAIVPAAHTQFRYRFAPGRGPRLYAQRAGATRDSLRLDDLVYTVEASYAIESEPYDLVKGMRDSYGLVYRMTSLDERYQAMVVKQRHAVQQVRVKLTPEERQLSFRIALELGSRAGSGAMYHTLTRNCTTELYDVLDRTVRYPAPRRLLVAVTSPIRTLPTLARQGLRVRGLLEPGSRSELVELSKERAAGGLE